MDKNWNESSTVVGTLNEHHIGITFIDLCVAPETGKFKKTNVTERSPSTSIGLFTGLEDVIYVTIRLYPSYA